MPGHFGDPVALSGQSRRGKLSGRRSVSRSATRALDILEYFGHTRRPFRAVEIARALDMHPSTTNQLLKTLVDSAHLTFDARAKTYLPAPRLTGFSAWMVDNYGRDERFNMALKEVHAETGTVVSLTTPRDLYMQVLELVGPNPSGAQRGLLVSLFGSAAVGDAYLSLLPDREVERLIRRARIPGGEVPDIFRKMSRIRDEGFAEGPTEDGKFRSIAIPLPPNTAPVPLVMAIADKPEWVQCNRTALRALMKATISRWIVV